MSTIKERFERICDMQKRLQKEILNLQEGCTHPNIEGKYDANTGNYDPNENSYWLITNCPDCGKREVIESYDDRYRTFKGKKI